MGLKPTYNASWNSVYDYLEDPGSAEKYRQFYTVIEPLIKHRLLSLGVREDLNGHARSIFSDLYLKELKRYQSGKLTPEKCSAQITTYYYPVVKNLCIDYLRVIRSKMPWREDISKVEVEASPGVFESLWGEHKNAVLTEMGRSVQDWIEFSNFEPRKKEYLRKRFIQGLKLPEIFKGVEKAEFDAQRKWVCRQGKKMASKIAKKILPAIIDCYKLPISKRIDPKMIEKYLLGIRSKIVAQ
jgi:hypothetical protein